MGNTLSDTTRNELELYLDSMAEDIHAKEPQEGEFTVEMFMEGRNLTIDIARYNLNESVRKGELTSRWGIVSGKRGRIYKRK